VLSTFRQNFVRRKRGLKTDRNHRAALDPLGRNCSDGESSAIAVKAPRTANREEQGNPAGSQSLGAQFIETESK